MANCTWCQKPGIPYEHNGQIFDGLCAHRGDRLCPSCRDAACTQEGVNIRVTDRDRFIDYTINTAEMEDRIIIELPRELRGVDGRDLHKYLKRKR